jgi:hypothetical protein
MADDLPDLPPVYHTGAEAPFDMYDPPARPPVRCVDPTVWKIAYTLYKTHRPRAGRKCSCGGPRPCELWWQALAALHASCPALEGEPPRLFAMCDEDGDVIAYGMTLPDGSAVTVQWSGRSGSVGLWSSPGRPARLWNCSLTWLDRDSADAAGSAGPAGPGSAGPGGSVGLEPASGSRSGGSGRSGGPAPAAQGRSAGAGSAGGGRSAGLGRSA